VGSVSDDGEETGHWSLEQTDSFGVNAILRILSMHVIMHHSSIYAMQERGAERVLCEWKRWRRGVAQCETQFLSGLEDQQKQRSAVTNLVSGLANYSDIVFREP
jgi:hypothetical protein